MKNVGECEHVIQQIYQKRSETMKMNEKRNKSKTNKKWHTKIKTCIICRFLFFLFSFYSGLNVVAQLNFMCDANAFLFYWNRLDKFHVLYFRLFFFHICVCGISKWKFSHQPTPIIVHTHSVESVCLTTEK